MTNNQVLAHFDSYNFRRYSRPWCATVKNGRYDFNNSPGYYTGQHNGNDNGGDIIITDPQPSIIYAYGQKDNRNPKYTMIKFAIWDGEMFVPCDKEGREI